MHGEIISTLMRSVVQNPLLIIISFLFFEDPIFLPTYPARYSSKRSAVYRSMRE